MKEKLHDFTMLVKFIVSPISHLLLCTQPFSIPIPAAPENILNYSLNCISKSSLWISHFHPCYHLYYIAP